MSFETKNLPFRQVMGNGLKYSVPRFQRDYSWKEEQWADLWQDIIASSKANSDHYMGYLVLQSSDNTNFTIIDGQQRLTTISILILAVLRELKNLKDSSAEPEKNKKRMEAIKSSFIGFTDPVSLQLEYKLNLNRNNDRHFKTYLCDLQDPPIRKINRSEKLMGEALKYFQKEIKSHFQNELTGEKTARLVESLARHLFFTVITVGSDINAYTVFETLNARGVQLSTPDLVKNYIFSLIDSRGNLPDEKIKGLEDKWSNIINQLGKHKFSDFIRVDWNSRKDFTRASELFKAIKTSLKDAQGATEYLNALQENSQIYSALQYEGDEFWKLCKEGAYNKESLKLSLRMLNWFNIVAPQSALISGFHRFSPKDFIKFVYYIETLSVRYNIICGKGRWDQESAYSKTAKAIKQSSDISPDKTAREILKNIYPSDEEFVSAFKEKTFKTQQTDKKARYFLYRIEKSLNPKCPPFEETSLEHILPKNPSEEWVKNCESGDNLEDWIHRIGNMTLLSPRSNISAGNKGFDEKKKAYFQKSSFKITEQCLQYDKWNESSIARQQEWLAQQAKKIWRFS